MIKRISCLIGLLAGAMSAADVTITVDVNKAAAEPIPRTIFGTFLEPIGDSTYNGLWAQLLENPSFEADLWSAGEIRKRVVDRPELEKSSDIGLPLPWEPLHAAQGWRYEPRWRDAANSQRSLLIMALPTGETGVRQRVYLPAHRCLEYRGSVYVKPVSGAADVHISLRRRSADGSGEVLASASFTAHGDSWAKHAFVLTVAAGKLPRLEPADFVIAIAKSARVLVDEAALTPADAVDGFDPEMVRMAQDMGTPLLRFGGNYTSGYHWRDGVGPMDARVSMLNQSWQMPEYNQFGTEEYLQFCRLIHAAPQIALNLGSGTPQEAADWVRYVDERWGNRHGGLLWELGNELWGNWQIGYPALEEVAGRTRAYIKAVRAVDPAARLIATGQDVDHFEQWNGAQLTALPGYSYLSTHFVVGPETVKADPSPEFIADASFALPIGLERRLRLAKQQIDADAQARGKVRIAFTEWLFVGDGKRVPNFTNMGGAVDAAGFLNMLLRNTDIVPISDMTGLIWFGGIWKKMGQVYGTPAYWAFRMYANANATRRVDVHAEGPLYDVHEGIRRIPEIPGVPYLDVVGAVNAAGDKLTLFCVNRKRDGALTASVRAAGFGNSGRATELTSSSIYDANDAANPDAVKPKQRTVQLDQIVFPPASVTVMEVGR